MPLNSRWTCHYLSWKAIGLLALLAVVILACIVAFIVYITLKGNSTSDSVMGVYARGAVVANVVCSRISRDILTAGGNAVDAAIAALLCDGVTMIYPLGVGGGFIMNIYNKTTGETISLVARETAPGKATQDMFVDRTKDATFGARAVAVPGELKGYQEAYRKFGGGVSWKALFEPSIRLCEEGVSVSKAMNRAFSLTKDDVLKSASFKYIILNSTKGELPVEGDVIKLPLLARTLRVLANSPKMADELYNGSLTEQFVSDIREDGGIITVEDMNNYAVRWKTPYKASLSDGLTVYSAPLPSSGILLSFILRLLDGLFQSTSSEIEKSQMMIEAFKHAYGHRTYLSDDDVPGNKTKLDEAIKNITDQESIMSIRKKINVSWTSSDVSYYGADYAEESSGTNNVVVLDPDGSAVSVTSTLNVIFGSKFVSKSTGILLNNQMDDFSTPGLVNTYGVRPSSANYIQPGKRPLSSMSPVIVLDSAGDVRLLVGAAGGSKITTQVSLVTIRNLWQKMNIKEAIDARRFHHQLLPMKVLHEPGIPEEMVTAWKGIGHETEEIKKWPNSYLGAVTGIARLGDNLTACFDFRRPAGTAGL